MLKYGRQYTVAAPIMEQYGIRGTFYLTVNYVAKKELPWFSRIIYLFKEAQRRNLVITDDRIRRTWNLGDPLENRQAFRQYANPCITKTGETSENYVAKMEKWFGFQLDLTAGPQMMTFAQAAELRQRGHIIGNHTFSHGNAAHIPPETLPQEINGANEILKQKLGVEINHFSYPHPLALSPQWNRQSLAATQQAAFRTAVLTDFGTVTKTDNPLLLRRVICGNEPASAFRWRLENAFAGRRV